MSKRDLIFGPDGEVFAVEWQYGDVRERDVSEYAELVKRLDAHTIYEDGELRDDLEESVQAILALEAQVEEMREALEPFASFGRVLQEARAADCQIIGHPLDCYAHECLVAADALDKLKSAQETR